EPAQFQKIRSFPFTFSLGLSATIEPYHVDGLGRIVETYTFPDAVRDGLIPQFDIVNVSLELTPSERANFEDLTEKLVDLINRVKDAFAAQCRVSAPALEEFLIPHSFRRVSLFLDASVISGIFTPR